MDEVRIEAARVIARAGNGLLLIVGDRLFERVGEGPMAGCEIRLRGSTSRWLVRLADTEREGDLTRFAGRLAGLAVRDGPDGTILVDDPDYGPVVCYPDGTIEAEGRCLVPTAWPRDGVLSRLAVNR